MTPQSRRLSRAYRRQQRLLVAALSVQLARLWPSLVGGDLDVTGPRWASQATAAVQAGHARSAASAAAFYRLFRRAETGGVFTPHLVEFDPQRTRRLLLGSSVGVIRKNLDVGWGEAVEKGRYWSTGTANRLALAGGRDTIRESVTEDPQALGWARAASGRACGFCAMLASRGPVYSETSVDFEAHDNCGCYPVPVFSRDQGWPDNSERFRDMWDESDGTLEDFRSLVESGT